jgi:hypothetical protein
MISMRSLKTIVRRYGRNVKKLGRVAEEAIVGNGMWYTLRPGDSHRMPTLSGGWLWLMTMTYTEMMRTQRVEKKTVTPYDPYA